MSRHSVLLFLIFILSLNFISCKNSSTNPVNGEQVSPSARIYINTTPPGAQIYQGSYFTNKITPDSLINLNPGNVNFTLKLFSYKDTTFTASLTPGQIQRYDINLTGATGLVLYGENDPVGIGETYRTPPTQPSGLILSNGRGVPVPNDSMDIVYYSQPIGPWELLSANLYPGRTRKTFFKIGSSSNLNDHIPSPQKDSTWVQKIDFSTANGNTVDNHYFFMYDQDNHYSKVTIYIGGGTGIEQPPSFAYFTWYYNWTAGDRNF